MIYITQGGSTSPQEPREKMSSLMLPDYAIHSLTPDSLALDSAFQVGCRAADGSDWARSW